jgi:hypothetical protein
LGRTLVRVGDNPPGGDGKQLYPFRGNFSLVTLQRASGENYSLGTTEATWRYHARLLRFSSAQRGQILPDGAAFTRVLAASSVARREGVQLMPISERRETRPPLATSPSGLLWINCNPCGAAAVDLLREASSSRRSLEGGLRRRYGLDDSAVICLRATEQPIRVTPAMMKYWHGLTLPGKLGSAMANWTSDRGRR